jgi:hypothetical protein
MARSGGRCVNPRKASSDIRMEKAMQAYPPQRNGEVLTKHLRYRSDI